MSNHTKKVSLDWSSFAFAVFMTVSLHRPVWPGTCYVDHAGLKPSEIHLPLPEAVVLYLHNLLSW